MGSGRDSDSDSESEEASICISSSSEMSEISIFESGLLSAELLSVSSDVKARKAAFNFCISMSLCLIVYMGSIKMLRQAKSARLKYLSLCPDPSLEFSYGGHCWKTINHVRRECNITRDFLYGDCDL